MDDLAGQGTPPSVSEAFREWFLIAEARCSLALVLKDRENGGLEIAILTNRAALPVFLTASQVTATAMHDDECWDQLLSLDVAPALSPERGFICESCKNEERSVFRSLDALWADHLFEPLLEWINTTLPPANAMALFQLGGMTWAKLLTREFDAQTADATVIMPL